MEELIGSLMTYEINLANKLQEGEDKKKKSIALKATTKEEKDVEEEKPSEEDDDLTLITRKLNKYMRSERFRGRKFIIFLTWFFFFNIFFFLGYNFEGYTLLLFFFTLL